MVQEMYTEISESEEMKYLKSLSRKDLEITAFVLLAEIQKAELKLKNLQRTSDQKSVALMQHAKSVGGVTVL